MAKNKGWRGDRAGHKKAALKGWRKRGKKSKAKTQKYKISFISQRTKRRTYVKDWKGKDIIYDRSKADKVMKILSKGKKLKPRLVRL